MKCPFCGKEMKEGYVAAVKSAVYFANRDNRIEATLTQNNILSPKGPAWCCADCQKVVADYSEISQKKINRIF